MRSQSNGDASHGPPATTAGSRAPVGAEPVAVPAGTAIGGLLAVLVLIAVVLVIVWIVLKRKKIKVKDLSNATMG